MLVVSFLGLDESNVRVGFSFAVTKGYSFIYLGILLSSGENSMLLLNAGSTFSRGTNGFVILFGDLSVTLFERLDVALFWFVNVCYVSFFEEGLKFESTFQFFEGVSGVVLRLECCCSCGWHGSLTVRLL